MTVAASKEEVALLVSAKATKGLGTATAGSGLVSLLIQYEHLFIVIATIIGAICTVISLCVHVYLARKKDRRDHYLHNLKVKALKNAD